jgi:hypothetical protein
VAATAHAQTGQATDLIFIPSIVKPAAEAAGAHAASWAAPASLAAPGQQASAPGAAEQAPTGGRHPVAPPSQNPDAIVRLGPAVGQIMVWTVIQHASRMTNAYTRQETMEGPFFDDWFTSAAGLFDGNWDDGNKWATNYLAHPAGGAVYGHIARRQSKYNGLLPGDKGYYKSVLLGMGFIAGASLNFEIGPISESSIGNVGLYNPDLQGWVDPVITPTIGTAWMVMEDYVYKHVLTKIESRRWRNFWHIVVNPARTMANICAFGAPWGG